MVTLFLCTLSRLAVGRRRGTFRYYMQHDNQFTARLAKPLREHLHETGASPNVPACVAP